MLHIIQQTIEMPYIGTEIKTNMSAAPQIKKTTQIASVKMTRKERRAQKEVEALREQSTCILPATTFKRIVTQEAANHSAQRLRFNADAVKALQAAAESELTNIFTGSAIVAGLAKRDTVTVDDMRNFQTLRNLN
jgi:histone H3/H4|tara:strand:+ start:2518 stop:2922 length:405 start_codon:yes stop_codon:yes gene_type:complete